MRWDIERETKWRRVIGLLPRGNRVRVCHERVTNPVPRSPHASGVLVDTQMKQYFVRGVVGMYSEAVRSG